MHDGVGDRRDAQVVFRRQGAEQIEEMAGGVDRINNLERKEPQQVRNGGDLHTVAALSLPIALRSMYRGQANLLGTGR